MEENNEKCIGRKHGGKKFMKRKIVIDSLLNIIATALPMIFLQMIYLPFYVKRFGNEEYALMVTIISLITMISIPLGGALGNVRLLVDQSYKKKKLQGDFNLLLYHSIILNGILIIAFSFFYYGKQSDLLAMLLTVLLSVFYLTSNYLIVEFRLRIDYKKIILNNIMQVVGLFIGFMLFHSFKYWQLIYLIGYIFSFIYIFKNTTLLKEKKSRTRLYNHTRRKYILLVFSSLLSNVMLYIDKLLLLPMIGSYSSAVYYASTVFGKLITNAINPITSVIVSYLVKIKTVEVKKFIAIMIFMNVVGIIGYCICIVLSKPIICLLYPELANSVMSIIYITTLSSVIDVLIVMCNSFILCYQSVVWQTVISGVNCIIYIVISISMLLLYGLYGFCLGILISKIIRLFISVIIYIKANKLVRQ